MLNKKGFTFVEVMIIVAVASLLFAIAIPNILRAKENKKARQQSEEFNEQSLGRYSQEIKNNRFIMIPHGDHSGKRIRVDTVRDTETGKSYIIFRGYDGITALEIK